MPPQPRDEDMAKKLALTRGLYCKVHRSARPDSGYPMRTQLRWHANLVRRRQARAPGAPGGAEHSFWGDHAPFGCGWGMVRSVAAERSAASCCGHAGEIAELHGELADLRAGVGELARAPARAGEEKTTGSGRAGRLAQGAGSMCLCILSSSGSILEPGGYTLGVVVHGRAIVVPIAWAERPPMSQEDR